MEMIATQNCPANLTRIRHNNNNALLGTQEQVQGYCGCFKNSAAFGDEDENSLYEQYTPVLTLPHRKQKRSEHCTTLLLMKCESLLLQWKSSNRNWGWNISECQFLNSGAVLQ